VQQQDRPIFQGHVTAFLSLSLPLSLVSFLSEVACVREHVLLKTPRKFVFFFSFCFFLFSHFSFCSSSSSSVSVSLSFNFVCCCCKREQKKQKKTFFFFFFYATGMLTYLRLKPFGKNKKDQCRMADDSFSSLFSFLSLPSRSLVKIVINKIMRSFVCM
jgi:D-alanyl-lipoteichoic acid acyltransferase DltB (MBOAT superfamily)